MDVAGVGASPGSKTIVKIVKQQLDVGDVGAGGWLGGCSADVEDSGGAGRKGGEGGEVERGERGERVGFNATGASERGAGGGHGHALGGEGKATRRVGSGLLCRCLRGCGWVGGWVGGCRLAVQVFAAAFRLY